MIKICKSFILGAAILLGLGATQASVDAAQVMGNAHFQSTAAYYQGNSLIIEGLIGNTGNSPLRDISSIEMSVQDKNGQLITSSQFNDPGLSNLVLETGDFKPWVFQIDHVQKADLSKYTVNSHAEFIYSNKPDYTSGVHVFVNNQPLATDVAAILSGGRTLVPMSSILKQIGANVSYESSTRTMTAKKGNIRLIHKIGTNIIEVNGKKVQMDVSSKVVQGRTLVPLRAITQTLGGTIMYGKTGDAMTIIIAI